MEEVFCLKRRSDGLAAHFHGWINDDSDPVGRVHLGAVHVCEAASETTITLRRSGEDIHQQGWWMSAEIKERGNEFEKWSLLALELIEGTGGWNCHCG